MPAVAASQPGTLQAGVAPLWDALWLGADGARHEGVDGTGVVGLTFEGFDMLHPDLAGCGDPDHHVAGYLQYQPLHPGPNVTIGPASAPKNGYQDDHGTHGAGVFCGSGINSRGDIRGVAFGSKLFSLEGVLCYTDYCPVLTSWFNDFPLRVVTHSLSSDILTHNPSSYPVEKAKTFGMPADADTLFFAAVGNQGGDGTTAETDPFVHSDPRMVGVAAANAYRDGVATYSSRGAKNDSKTWPDIVAPACSYATQSTTAANGAVVGVYSGLLENLLDSRDCPPWDPIEHVERTAQGYGRGGGTSSATPFAAGVAMLMFQVNPGLTAANAFLLLTRTADTDSFLPTNDTDGDGRASPEEFYHEHGWEAGWGFVNATRAVTAAHYWSLHPNAALAEVLTCSKAVEEGGVLVLNPPGPGCPAQPAPVSGDSHDPIAATPDASKSPDSTPPAEPASRPQSQHRTPWAGSTGFLLAACLALWLPRRRG